MNQEYISAYSKEIEKVIRHIPNILSLKGKSVFVSGCTGMLCSAVVDVLFYLNERYHYEIKLYLAGRDKAHVLERYNYWIGEFEYIYYDAEDASLINIDKLDFIIHGASNASPRAYVSEPVETMLANSLGTKTLLDLALKCKARFLYVSSSEIYGKKESSESYKEEDYRYVDILNPRSCYPSSKRFAETLCMCYSDEYGVDAVIVRPGHIYGHTITPKDDRASAQFTLCALNGHNIVMKSEGRQLRSYCFVLDCASALLCVLINGESNNAYNISNSGSLVSIKQMAEAFAEAGNVEIVFENPTRREVNGFNLMENSALDSSKLESLGWCGEYTMQLGAETTLSLLSLRDGE